MFICLQKNNFITHFFLKILQRNNKIVTLGNIGMSGRLHTPKMIVSMWRNLWRLSIANKSASTFTFSLGCCKDIANLLFWVLWACLATHTQSDTTDMLKTFAFICRQKINFIFHVFLEILKDMQTYLVILVMSDYAHPKC